MHSAAPEDPLPVYHGDAPLHAPFTDVTVTDYRPVSSGGGEGPVFIPCAHEEGPCYCAAPGSDYTSYATAWDDPLTGHLLSRARTPAPPLQPIPQQPHQQQADSKRRNVTQV
ncbi:hypothetical protein Pmani_003893 [Petrolisthes manimaculis]|uniref:Uncharacterized protein n=1 Tax=Petrolisthes manimaculis TaxID=1843537 RepID=A0AAE1QF52_9EUCA|nr:hypothetical protein Pmani_003893 [Petrolisthes manimaculis]